MLIQEEKQREIQLAGHFLTDSASLATEVHKPQQFHRGRMDRVDSRIDLSRNRFERNEGKKPSLYYNYYKKPGHSIEECYRLHGFPPNQKFRGGRGMVAFAQADDQGNDHHGSISQNTQTVVPGLTQEQSPQLMALLQNV